MTDPLPPIDTSWRLDSFRHPPHRDQIAIGRDGTFLAPTPRGFLPWTLSDDGPSACRTVPIGRRPKPFTKADLRGSAIERTLERAFWTFFAFTERSAHSVGADIRIIS